MSLQVATISNWPLWRGLVVVVVVAVVVVVLVLVLVVFS